MERLMVSPVTRLDMVVGYLCGFFVFALVQTFIILFFTIYVFDITYRGQLWEILVFQIAVIVGAVNLGIFISSFARNEFQMVQFIPLIIVPQIFLCGLLWPVEQMPDYLQWISRVLPLTYAVDGLRGIMQSGKALAEVGRRPRRPRRLRRCHVRRRRPDAQAWRLVLAEGCHDLAGRSRPSGRHMTAADRRARPPTANRRML